MKKVLLAMALVLSVTFASAQSKAVSDARKAIDKAVAASLNPKKATKPATWISLAKAYISAYELPSKGIEPGFDQMLLKTILKDQQVLSSTQKTLPQGTFTVDTYVDKELYYNDFGQLVFLIVTKPIEENLLGKAQNALFKAAEVDPKGSKLKDIQALFEQIHNFNYEDAASYYNLGDYDKATAIFEECLGNYNNKVMRKVDTMVLYNTALLSSMSGDNAKAERYYKQCLEYGYYSDGNVFSNLAEIYRLNADTLSQKKTLEAGFEQFPQNQGILVGLINLYTTTKEDPKKLFDIIHSAQENEPNNGSLYYAEGNVYKELGNIEKAVELYNKSTEIQPDYVYGVLSVGVLYYEQAMDIAEKADSEFDQVKYDALVEEFNQNLENAIPPFEKAFSISDNLEIKRNAAEFLKFIYFRFRDKSPEYMAAYEKYNAFLAE